MNPPYRPPNVTSPAPAPAPQSGGMGRNDPRLTPGEKLDAGSTLVHLLDKDEFERVFEQLGVPFLVVLLGAAILLGRLGPSVAL